MALGRGTVTFVFTDVEGSTRLVKLLRDAYGEALATHQRIVRAAFASFEGHEIDTQGDAFFYVFPRARDAALAAAAAQRALAAHEWPQGAEFKIRIGLHTGEPNLSAEGRYHGMGVHRTARIMAAGHGGQILASRATASVLEDDELEGITLRDLGEHRLKDLDHPERICQLDVDGLPTQFAPLKTLDLAPVEEKQKAKLRTVFLSRRRRAIGVLALVILTLGISLPVILGGTATALSQVDANALGIVDESTARIATEVKVGASPTQIAVGDGSVWLTNTDERTVSRVDPTRAVTVQTIAVGSSPSGVAIGNDAVWVTNSLDATVSRIDPKINRVVQTIKVGNGPLGILYTAGSIWVANTGDDTISKIDANTGTVVATLNVAATDFAFGDGTIWASQRTGSHVVRIDPGNGVVVQSIAVGNGPNGIAFGGGSAWVTNKLDGTISRIDARTNAVSATVPVGNGPTDVVIDRQGVWVVSQFDGTLSKIDPKTDRIVRRRTLGNQPQGIAVAGNRVLVTVRGSGEGHRGGRMTVRMGRPTDYIDTAAAYDSTSWSILRMTGDGLVAFNQATGLEGTQLVPDLAVSLPVATDGGKTYTFRLRPDIHYSDGSGLKASDFRFTLERDFKLGLLPVAYYDDIVGVDACKRKPTACDLSRGIVADDTAEAITFHLTAADPEFLYKVALPFTYVLPATTPLVLQKTHPLPATGPYVITTYDPKRRITLERNKQFREWSQAAQPDGYPDAITFEIGGTPDAATDAVLAGKADLFSSSQSETPPSEANLTAAQTRYASQVHINPQPATIAYFMNTSLPPFNDIRVRRALNYAVDRSQIVRLSGGAAVAETTCQILPPHFPGYEPYCPYTTGSTSDGLWKAADLDEARALIAASGTRGMKITVWSWEDLTGIGPYAVSLLRSLGYRVTMRAKAGFDYFGLIGDSRNKPQIGVYEWISDYPAASGFFTPILTCASFVPGSPYNTNAAQFCDKRIDDQIARAAAEQASNPDAARGLWQRVDKQTVDEAPWVPLANPQSVDVLSGRVGNYQFSPPLGVLIDQLWLH